MDQLHHPDRFVLVVHTFLRQKRWPGGPGKANRGLGLPEVFDVPYDCFDLHEPRRGELHSVPLVSSPFASPRYLSMALVGIRGDSRCHCYPFGVSYGSRDKGRRGGNDETEAGT